MGSSLAHSGEPMLISTSRPEAVTKRPLGDRSPGLDPGQLAESKLLRPAVVGVPGQVAGEHDEVDVGVGPGGVARVGADQKQAADVGPNCGPSG